MAAAAVVEGFVTTFTAYPVKLSLPV